MPFVVADTDGLTRDGVISAQAARVIEARAREVMVNLAINALLSFGILAAPLGRIFGLADPAAEAVVGGLSLGGGLMVLARRREVYRMFGNAAALIGAGMLLGGSSIELIDKHPDIAGWVMAPAGAMVAAIAGRALWRGGLTARVVQGAILLMGLAQHLGGIGWLLVEAEVAGLPRVLFFLYVAASFVIAGWLTDVRLITALAIVPFAQALETGTAYFHAAYVFFSPEPTLTIVQMALLIAVLVGWVNRSRERIARHGRVLTVMAFIVANLCALVGSLWGDVVGETLWGPGGVHRSADFETYDSWAAAREAFLESAIHVPPGLYSIFWALALVAVLVWAAHGANRGLFNTAMTFAAIHAYTQLFESFGDEPLVYVIGGLSAIPLAWGMWRANAYFTARHDTRTEGAN